MSGDNSSGAAHGGEALSTPRRGASLPMRALWFVFVGWWLTGIWALVSWFLLVSVVGAPVGIKLLNGLPKVLSLKESSLLPPSAIGACRLEQRSLLVRAGYFLLVGWWLSAIWTALAYGLTVSIVGLHFGIGMFARVPYVVSLYRY